MARTRIRPCRSPRPRPSRSTASTANAATRSTDPPPAPTASVRPRSRVDLGGPPVYPKIELHVHLEATVRPETLLEVARRNDYPLPANTVEELTELYRFRDFRHFIEVWILTTNALQQEADFRQMVADYAAEAKRHGAVYIEGIFTPAERVRRGVNWQEGFDGVCAGAQEARE